MNNIPNNIVRQVLLLLFIIFLGIILFQQLQSFLPALLGAYTFFVIFKKWMYILTGKYKWNRSLAAGLLMLLSFLVILLPIVMLVNMLASRINFAIQHSSNVLATIEQFIHNYEKKYNVNIISEENMHQLTGWSAQTLQKLVGATFNSLITIVFTYFILYFMLIGEEKWKII